MPATTTKRGDTDDTPREQTTDTTEQAEGDDVESASRAPELLPDADRIRENLQRARAPHIGIGGTVAAGFAADWLASGIDALTPAPNPLVSSLGVAAFSALAVGGTMAGVQWNHREVITAAWRRRYWVAGTVSAAWVALATFTGVTFVMLSTLLIVEYMLAAGWMRAHRLSAPIITGDQVPEAPQHVEAAPLSDLDTYVQRWDRYVAGKSGPFKGSYLRAGENTDHGLLWEVQLEPGAELGSAQSHAGMVASALQVDPLQIVVEAHPPKPGQRFRDASLARLQVLQTSPAFGVVTYTEPMYRWEDSKLALQVGPFADGRGMGEIDLLTEDSAWSTVVIGSTGSGKSATSSGLVVSARAAVPTVTMYLDPKGNSNVDLTPNATVAETGLGRAEEFTAAVEELLEGRRLRAEAEETSGFTPSPDKPLYLIVIDECDMLFALKGMADRWGLIAKTARALGACLVLATQYAGLKAFGNNEFLRSNVAAGNVVLMRTTSKTSDALIAPELPNSRSLPAEPGYGYLQNRSDGRVAPLRGAYLPPKRKCPDGYNVAVALQQNPDADLDPEGREALAPLLAVDKEQQQRERAERARERYLAFINGERSAVRARDAVAGGEDSEDGIEVGEVIPFPEPPSPDDIAPPVPAELQQLSEYARGALAVITDGTSTNPDGITRTGQVVESCGWSRDTVAKALRELQDAGLITAVKQGQYRLADGADAVKSA